MPDGSLEDVQGHGLDIELVSVPVGLIDPDPANPNVLDEQRMETLSKEIDRGFVQPVLLRPNGDRYTMVDGHHRLKLVAEKGYTTIPSVIEDFGGGQAGEDAARIRGLTMNRLRGEFVPIRLALVLADLTKRIPEQELRGRLGMDQGEFTDTVRLAGFTDDVRDRVREAVDREERRAPRVLTFTCANPRDADVIEKAVQRAMKDGEDRGTGLARVCRAYKPKR